MSAHASDWLVPLSLTTPLEHIADSLERLERCAAADELAHDDFERTFVQRWLSSVVALGIRRAEEDFESILSRASGLTASLAGRSASGPSSKRYKFGAIELDIGSGTLRDDSVGSLTWRSAEVLARRMTAAPEQFMPEGTRRVIELGCGTGLVGLAAAAILRTEGRDARVVLSDFDPLALDQARQNAVANGLDVGIQRLDWREPVGEADRHAYDVALGADLTYDVVEPLVAVLGDLLRPGGSFHLVTPMRARHVAMADAVVAAFGQAPWRIVANETEESPSDVEGAEGLFRYLHVQKATL